jgi:hypothetical protein
MRICGHVTKMLWPDEDGRAEASCASIKSGIVRGRLHQAGLFKNVLRKGNE